MKGKCYTLLFLVASVTVSAQQRMLNIHGSIKSADSQEPVIGAVIQDTLSKAYTISDEYGFFTLSLPGAHGCLRTQYIGYEPRLICGVFEEGQAINIELSTSNFLPQVEVSSYANRGVPKLGRVSLPISTLQLLPQLGGEADLLKTITLLPGIAQGVEGTTGLLVRGGSPDQNLVLMDGAPVYNLSHFGAYLSVFNTDAIKHFDVYKASWPAKYGGRLSGLVDIRTREGNLKHWEGKATISPLLGRLLVEGPLKTDKTSFLLSARSSWLGVLFNAFSGQDFKQRYLMYDLNGKLTHRINDNHRIYLSYYSSLDDSQVEEVLRGGSLGNQERIKSEEAIGVKWGNQTASLRYATFLSDRWSLQSIIYYTRYRFSGYQREMNLFANGSTTSSFNANASSNQDFGIRAFAKYTHRSLSFILGTEQVSQRFAPQSTFQSEGRSATLLLSDARAFQQNYFSDVNIRLGNAADIRFGVRQVVHQASDTTFLSLEPRLEVESQLGKGLWASLSANYGQQFMHLITGGNAGQANEIWLGATASAPPQQGAQVAMGIRWLDSRARYEVSLEAFHRRMSGLTELKAVGNSGLEDVYRWEELLEFNGKGRVDGLELLLRKQEGRLTGWLSYTWSKSLRQFDQINQGEWFPFRFDRRHDCSVALLYALSKKWQFSATWSYQTGSRITLPTAKIPNTNIAFEDIFFPGGAHINDQRNNVTLPSYHRLDLGCTYSWQKREEGPTHDLSLSIYNAYNRINPYFIRTETTPRFSRDGQYLGEDQPEVVIVGLFPFIPSLSYSRTFDWK
ncbi:MAG: TonB-dependent receptor [bacterium]|nr:TonB-dependent receptor [bacterium]